MQNVDIDGTPFSVLMDRAVKLKSLQTKHEREQYDQWPSFYANTLFSDTHKDVVEAREIESFNDRLEAASRMKEDGNSAFRDGRLSDALVSYEKALSVWRFLENTNPAFKSEGIKDQFIKEHRYECKDDDERKRLNMFLVMCYNNIALVSYKMGDYQLAIKATDYAIVVDPTNEKAFYIRAKARIAPKSSGSLDESLARSDLKIALSNNPHNQEAKKLLQSLNAKMKLQRSKDKMFKGLFDRGELYDAQGLHEEKEARRISAQADKINSKQQDIILGKQLAQIYEERGMDKEKKRLEESIMHETQQLDKDAYLNGLDFRNPSKQMIADAQKMGVDLHDAQTVELLEKMREGKNNGGLLAGEDKRLCSEENVSVPASPNKNLGCGQGGLTATKHITLLAIFIFIVGYVWRA